MKTQKTHLIIATILSTLTLSNIAQAKLCPTVDVEAEARTQALEASCGAGIKVDLKNFSTDKAICGSKKQGLEIVESVIKDLCREHAEELKTKINTIRIMGWDKTETQYQLKDKTLIAQVPYEESAILPKWNQESEKLTTFIKTQVKFSAPKPAAKPEMSAAEKAALEKQKARSAKQAEGQSKRQAIMDKYKAAGDAYKAKVMAIMSRPGTSPEDMNKKKKDSDEAQAEFKKAEETYNKEMQELK